MMSVTPHVILLLIGAICMFVSALASLKFSVDLYRIGWGFVVLAFIFP